MGFNKYFDIASDNLLSDVKDIPKIKSNTVEIDLDKKDADYEEQHSNFLCVNEEKVAHKKDYKNPISADDEFSIDDMPVIKKKGRKENLICLESDAEIKSKLVLDIESDFKNDSVIKVEIPFPEVEEEKQNIQYIESIFIDNSIIIKNKETNNIYDSVLIEEKIESKIEYLPEIENKIVIEKNEILKEGFYGTKIIEIVQEKKEIVEINMEEKINMFNNNFLKNDIVNEIPFKSKRLIELLKNQFHLNNKQIKMIEEHFLNCHNKSWDYYYEIYQLEELKYKKPEKININIYKERYPNYYVCILVENDIESVMLLNKNNYNKIYDSMTLDFSLNRTFGDFDY